MLILPQKCLGIQTMVYNKWDTFVSFITLYMRKGGISSEDTYNSSAKGKS